MNDNELRKAYRDQRVSEIATSTQTEDQRTIGYLQLVILDLMDQYQELLRRYMESRIK